MADTDKRVGEFKSHLSSNLLARDDFIDWDLVGARLKAKSKDIAHLQAFVAGGNLSRDQLASLLGAYPGVYPLLLDLLAFNSTGTQVEKWGLPEAVDADIARNSRVADQLYYVGIDKILATAGDVESLLRVAEVYKDGNRRRFRSGKKLDERVRSLVTNAIRDASAELNTPLRTNAASIPDLSLRRALSYIIAMGNRPIAGIATVFQNQSGGRQLRDLSVIYPNLQQRLSEYGASLILIADGQGVQDASDRVLAALVEGVRFPLTLSEASDGMLRSALIESATGELPETLDTAALNRLIDERIRADVSVSAADLPVAPDQGRIALATFANSRRRANLTLSASGDRLEWANVGWVRRARNLKLFFDKRAALDLFVEMLGAEASPVEEVDGELLTEVTPPSVPPFSDALHITASGKPIEIKIARDVGRRSMERTPRSSLAIYLTGSGIPSELLPQHRKEQILRAANIIVLSAPTLEHMATAKRPIDRLIEEILLQSDLTKVSPFILSNPTPSRMFYGRVSEAATVQRTLSSNSVAILGSRRMGKTSLIRRLRDDLANTNFQPFFGDCQTVKTWGDFAQLAAKMWQVTLPSEFGPFHLSDLVEQLRSRGDGQVVIILDEIDQLISWDQTHDENTVPEAFFRACRAISQDGRAQFVFSGERTIANRLWDAQSPHWNFCRELQLTQLDRADATSLLVEPLRAMNIGLPDHDLFVDVAWERTSGHPQIVQFLGDRLVRLLDERVDRRNMALSADDAIAVTSTTEFADHYLTTYWGQATRLERDISEIVSQGEISPASLFERLNSQNALGDQDEFLRAIRMLQLYGILSQEGEQLTLRATWFPIALEHFGSLNGDQVGGDNDASARTGATG